MDTNERLKQLMKEKSITEYRLAIDSGLSKSTIAAILHRNTTPSALESALKTKKSKTAKI